MRFKHCDEILPQGSATGFINAVSIELLRIPSESKRTGVYEVCPDNITVIKYDKATKQFKGQSPHYMFMALDKDILNQIPITRRKQAVKKPDTNICINAGGARTKSNWYFGKKIPMEKDCFVIEELFQQDTYKGYNSCVWLAAAMIINSIDRRESMVLVNELRNDPGKFDWINILPNAEVPNNQSLYGLLRIVKSKYTVKKLRFDNSMKSNKYIMEIAEKGIFIAMLEDDTGSQTHAIGIDVQSRKIYDCEEEYELNLTYQNLSRCCGESRNFVSLNFVCEIIPF
jgi:hypothetical protein